MRELWGVNPAAAVKLGLVIPGLEASFGVVVSLHASAAVATPTIAMTEKRATFDM